MSDQPKRSFGPRLGLGAIAAIAVGVGVAVYVSGAGNGNQASAGCPGTAAVAAKIDPLIEGEVAAFRTSGTPVSLTDYGFQRPDGTPVSLADFAGKTVLLNLWATWCVPCRQEMPSIDRLAASMPADQFAVVAVSLDTTGPEKPTAFLDEIGVKALDLYVDPDLRLLNRMKGIGLRGGLPTTVLVDADGCRIGVMEGPAEWDSPDAVRLINATLAAEEENRKTAGGTPDDHGRRLGLLAAGDRPDGPGVRTQ